MSGTSMIPGGLSSIWQDVALSWHCHSTPQRQFCAATMTKAHQGLPCSLLNPAPQGLHGSGGVWPRDAFLGGCLLNGGASMAKSLLGGVPKAG